MATRKNNLTNRIKRARQSVMDKQRFLEQKQIETWRKMKAAEREAKAAKATE